MCPNTRLIESANFSQYCRSTKPKAGWIWYASYLRSGDNGTENVDQVFADASVLRHLTALEAVIYEWHYFRLQLRYLVAQAGIVRVVAP